MRFIIILSVIVLFTIGNGVSWAEGTEETDSGTMEKEDAMPAPVIFTGYLVDVNCGTTGKGLDGSNIVTGPEEHTKHCLEVCAASGFGISILNSDGETYKFIKFDSNGTALSAKILEMLGDDQSAKISVKGVLENNMITVEEIELINS